MFYLSMNDLMETDESMLLCPDQSHATPGRALGDFKSLSKESQQTRSVSKVEKALGTRLAESGSTEKT